MSSDRRWTYEDQCQQLAEARRQLAIRRKADRYFAELVNARDAESACRFGVVLCREHPGMLHGQVRLARRRQSDALPILLSESLVNGAVFVELLAAHFDEELALSFFNEQLRLGVSSLNIEHL